MQNIRVSIRTLFGIIIPGGFFCLLLFWGFFGILGSFRNVFTFIKISDFATWFLITVLIILSYIAGNIIRLTQADKVDRKSVEYHQRRNNLTRDDFDKLCKKIYRITELLESKTLSPIEKEKKEAELEEKYKEYDEMVFKFDYFPYRNWQMRKCYLYPYLRQYAIIW